jgi:hypothetical protein
MNEHNLKKILSDPFYCLPKVDDSFVIEHEPLVSEEVFTRASAKLIEEIGAEQHVKLMLENLKSKHVTTRDIES